MSREIKSTILKINFNKDKNLKDFLVLKVDNDSNILVFPNKINQLEWITLKVGKTYQFTLEEGKKKKINILTKFVLV